MRFDFKLTPKSNGGWVESTIYNGLPNAGYPTGGLALILWRCLRFHRERCERVLSNQTDSLRRELDANKTFTPFPDARWGSLLPWSSTRRKPLRRVVEQHVGQSGLCLRTHSRLWRELDGKSLVHIP